MTLTAAESVWNADNNGIDLKRLSFRDRLLEIHAAGTDIGR
jgi:hypothetical protein